MGISGYDNELKMEPIDRRQGNKFGASFVKSVNNTLKDSGFVILEPGATAQVDRDIEIFTYQRTFVQDQT